MKFYVAARFTEKGQVKKIYKHLQEKGHEITADWTLHKTIKPYDKNAAIAKSYAIEDMNGVINADVFILLTSEHTGAGSAGELGAAILSQVKTGKPKIYVVGMRMDNNFFYFHPAVIRKNTIEEVLQAL
jgi:hypothetical protein